MKDIGLNIISSRLNKSVDELNVEKKEQKAKLYQ
jgi:hypothetical protein